VKIKTVSYYLTIENKKNDLKKFLVSTFDTKARAFWALARCAILCNRADFKQDSENLARPVSERECHGDQSEAALLRCIELSVSRFALIDYSFIIFNLYRLAM
jgi:hypothetical protein